MAGRGRPEINEFVKEVISTFLAIIEEKDKYFRAHCERVARNCAEVAKKLDLPEHSEIERIYFAGLLHDIGMVYLSTEILLQQRKLTAEEMSVVKQHPEIGEKILSNLTLLRDILPMIRHHHESFDGTGYPDGLSGKEIPLGARILRLVDSYDAMTSDRSYRQAMSREQALEQIHENSGKEFDGDLIEPFVAFLKYTEGTSPPPEAKETEKDDGTVQDILQGIVQQFKQGKVEAPVLPKVVQGIQKVIKSPMSTADKMARVIERDAVISLKLISIANSPFYRGVKEIKNVRNAIPRLGLKETENIVIAVSNKSLYRTSNPLFRKLMEDLWMHSLACAYAARAIAEVIHSMLKE